MSREAIYLPLLLVALLVFGGCRRAAPPSFTPGPEVQALTAELEDADEKKLYQGLQSQIASLLSKYVGSPDKIKMLGETEEDDSSDLKLGYQLYSRYCVQCHGVNGDGMGAVAEHLNPKPRNYTHGIFKFTSTPYGSKPRRSDLMQTVRRGVTGTSMPSFDRFSVEELGAVVDYVLALTHRGELERTLAMTAYDDEELPDEEGVEELIEGIMEPWRNASTELVMPSTVMPPMTEESVRAGHKIFLKQACNKCHGTFGRGGSMGNVEVGADAWGYKTAAADLSSGMFRGGGRPIDLWRRINSGINGTPMPAFEKTFADNPEAIWQLVHFIKQTGSRRRFGQPPLSEADLPIDDAEVAAPAVSEEVEDEEAAEEEAPAEGDATDAESSENAESSEETESSEPAEETGEEESAEPEEEAAPETEAAEEESQPSEESEEPVAPTSNESA
ncbi:MAG: c-type cytochrome [Planctomycetales bacterium]|nr:c-type cytochrome [Planctomycetales bacterium]